MIRRVFVLALLPAALAAAPADAPVSGLMEAPSPITPGSLAGLCYYQGLAYSPGSMISVPLPGFPADPMLSADADARADQTLICLPAERGRMTWTPLDG